MDDTDMEGLEGHLALIASDESEFTPGQHALIANRLNGILQSFKQERTKLARIGTALVEREAALKEWEDIQKEVAEIGKNTTERLDKQTTSIDGLKDGLAKIGENATVKGINEKAIKIGEAVDETHKKVSNLGEDSAVKGINDKATKIGETVNDTQKKVSSLGEDNKNIKTNLTKIGETVDDTHKKVKNLGEDSAIKSIGDKVSSLGDDNKDIKKKITEIGDSKTFKDISKGVQGIEKTFGTMSEAMTGLTSNMSTLTLDGIANKVKEGLPAPTDLSNIESAVQALTTTVNNKLTAQPNDTSRLQEQYASLETENRQLAEHNNLLRQENETLSSKEVLARLVSTADERERIAQESKREWESRALRSEEELKKVDAERQRHSSEANRLDQRLKRAQQQLAEMPPLRAQLETAKNHIAELNIELKIARERPTKEETTLQTRLATAAARPTKEEMRLAREEMRLHTELTAARQRPTMEEVRLTAKLTAAQRRPTEEETALQLRLIAAAARPTKEEMELSVQLNEAQNDLKNARANGAPEIEKLKTELDKARNDLEDLKANSATEMEKLKTELETAQGGLAEAVKAKDKSSGDVERLNTELTAALARPAMEDVERLKTELKTAEDQRDAYQGEVEELKQAAEQATAQAQGLRLSGSTELTDSARKKRRADSPQKDRPFYDAFGTRPLMVYDNFRMLNLKQRDYDPDTKDVFLELVTWLSNSFCSARFREFLDYSEPGSSYCLKAAMKEISAGEQVEKLPENWDCPFHPDPEGPDCILIYCGLDEDGGKYYSVLDPLPVDS
ncbi:hypothetical protein K4K52_007524 [Colletotrichum sp. SAR 10_76]|nr:hypothetical protein K4K52_007524 [Colletotrichum sp. SAR 10_76]